MPLLILIRHAETDYVGKRLAGDLPGVHLNQHGRAQAEVLRQKLSEVPINAIFSSPLERAIETAEPLANQRGLPVNILHALMEINVGEWQGKSLQGLRRLKRWRETHEEPARFSFPQGESFADKQRAMCTALNNLMQNAGEKDIIACISHGDPIKLSLAYFLAMDLNNFQRLVIDPASASFVYFKENHIKLGPINWVENIYLVRTKY
jgi:broad specificity phosphatase PhoE